MKASHCDYKMMLLMLDDIMDKVVDMVEVEVIAKKDKITMEATFGFIPSCPRPPC